MNDLNKSGKVDVRNIREKPRMFDLERLREDIDMRKILPNILSRDEYRYSGSTMYCKCVSGKHSETRIEHNAVSEKYCHCFSCQENYDAFAYIEQYYAQQGLSLSFSEICEKIGDALGGSDLYETNERLEKKAKLPISKEDLELIGIHAETRKNSPSILDMYAEEPRRIEKLLRDRAYETMMKNKALSEQLEQPELSKKYLELYQRCREIYEELGGEEKSMVTLFKL